MKHRNILILILLLATFTVTAQNYSPCYTNNIAKGDAAYKQGKYSEARTYYATAKQCAGSNPSVAQQKINSCDAKIKAQNEEAEAKRREEEDAARAKRKAELEAAEAKRKAEEETVRQRNIAEAKSRGYEEITVKGIVFKMIYVEGGAFTMGCTLEQGGDCYGDENPTHQVSLSDYFIGETEVTQALWKAVMGDNPSCFKGDKLPVEKVSWNDCQKFIRKLNQLTGRTFRLPTEAEWEYAARGGNRSQHYKYAGSNSIGNVAWYTDNCSSATHPVKGKQANELGLYDMSGNVWEWCSDWKGSYDSSLQTTPQGPSSGSTRVLRGGSWVSYAGYSRVSHRNCGDPADRRDSNGFRLVLVYQ